MLHTGTQKLCTWSGIVAIALFGLAFWPTSQFIPPPAPTLTPAEVAALYRQNTDGIRVGMLLMSLAGAFVGPFVAGGLIGFFKTGPFAWNGLLSFYVAGVVFGVWFVVMTRMLLKAIARQGESCHV